MAKTSASPLLKTLVVLSILLNLAGAVYVGKKFLQRRNSLPRTAPKTRAYYLDRDKLFEAIPPDSGAIVFLGNSLTQYFELAEFFPGKRVKNRGIHGDMLFPVLQRLGPVIASKPTKIFIELGVNDTEQQVPADVFLSQYRSLVDTLQQTLPDTKLFVESLLPVSDTSSYLPASYCSPEMNKKIVEVNKLLAKLANEKRCTFLDVHTQFLEGSQLNPRYSVDGVHLSGEGYRLWAALLAPHVNH